MNIVSLGLFRRPGRSYTQPNKDVWRADEIAKLIELFHSMRRNGGADAYEFGWTERGDPQFYVLSSDPDQPCACSVSRLSGLDEIRPWYVLENGAGQVVSDGRCLTHLVEAMRRGGPVFLANLIGIVVAVPQFIENAAGLLLGRLSEGEIANGAVEWAPQIVGFA